MSRIAAWFVHASAVLVGGTGLVYAWMRFLVMPIDEFALTNHPWEPAVRDLHVLAAPLSVFACGLLWSSHIWGRLRAGITARRRTGIVLAAALAPMVVSGYLIQTTVDTDWRTAWIWTHVACGGLWCVGYLAHQLCRRRAPTA